MQRISSSLVLPFRRAIITRARVCFSITHRVFVGLNDTCLEPRLPSTYHIIIIASRRRPSAYAVDDADTCGPA
jgi:hypothetical protein